MRSSTETLNSSKIVFICNYDFLPFLKASLHWQGTLPKASNTNAFSFHTEATDQGCMKRLRDYTHCTDYTAKKMWQHSYGADTAHDTASNVSQRDTTAGKEEVMT